MDNIGSRAKIPSDLDAVPDEDGIVADSEQGYELVSIPTLPDTENARLEPPVTVYQNKQDTSLGEPSGNPPEWLIRTWEYYGRKQSYDIQAWTWEGEYPNLWQLVQDAAKQGIIQVTSGSVSATVPGSTPNNHFVILQPVTWERLKQAVRQRPGPKTHQTQITVDGKTRYMSDRVRMILDADIPALVDTIEGDLDQIRNTRNMRVRRRLKAELHDVILLRRKDVPRDVYGSVCLRLGMPLPSDFWHIPPERLGNYSTGSTISIGTPGGTS
jgi:hypothetical protein